MPTERWCALLSVSALATLFGLAPGLADTPNKPAAPQPATQSQPLDLGLLEFLGSADPTTDETHADGGSWMVYLSKLSLGKSAHSTQPTAAPAPASKPVPPSSSAEGSR